MHASFSHDGWTNWFWMFGYSAIGENLAGGYDNESEAHKALMASPTHRANIADKRYQYIGVGSACNIQVELFGGV